MDQASVNDLKKFFYHLSTYHQPSHNQCQTNFLTKKTMNKIGPSHNPKRLIGILQMLLVMRTSSRAPGVYISAGGDASYPCGPNESDVVFILFELIFPSVV